MFNKAIFYGAIMTFLILAGCATRYTEPAKDAATATLTIVHRGSGFPSATRVNIFDNERCEATKNSGRIGVVGKANDLSETPKNARIEVGKKVFVSVEGMTSNAFEKPGNTWTVFNCVNLLSFVPEAGKSYTVSQSVFAGNRCTARIVSHESSETVSEQHVTPSTCEVKGF